MEHVDWLTEREARAWEAFQHMQLRLNGGLARQLSEDSGLSHQDYAVLVALTGTPEGRMRLLELSRVLGWEKSRLSHHITRMVTRGLVAKEKCPEDGRGSMVVVTDQGQSEIEAAAPGHVAAVRRLFMDHVTDDQLDVLAEIAAKVLAALDAADGGASTDSADSSPQ